MEKIFICLYVFMFIFGLLSPSDRHIILILIFLFDNDNDLIANIKMKY